MEFVALNFLNGAAFGMLLFLIASGLSLTLGIMGVLNLAHGALYMVGGYIGWTVAVQLGLNWGLGVFCGAIGAGLLGLIIERGLLRHLYGLLNDQVLLTFGLVYIIKNSCQWIWGTVPKVPFTAPYLSGSLDIMGQVYPVSRVAVIGLGIIIAAALWWLIDKTRVGAMVRAGMDNSEMTEGLGINVALVCSAVFCLGAFLAGAAGVIGADLMGVRAEQSLDIMLYGLIVVVVGGMGSVPGALIGGLVIGIVDSFIRGLSPELGYFSMYMIMAVILLIRPTGILGRTPKK